MKRHIKLFNRNASLGYKAESGSHRSWWEECSGSRLLIIAIMFLPLFMGIGKPRKVGK